MFRRVESELVWLSGGEKTFDRELLERPTLAATPGDELGDEPSALLEERRIRSERRSGVTGSMLSSVEVGKEQLK